VDFEKRTEYDAYISFSLSLVGNQKVETKKNNTKKQTNPFKKYDNTGLLSTPK
jgi:hypothetical protein